MHFGGVVVLMLVCGFCDGFIDMLLGHGIQGHGGQVNPYANLAFNPQVYHQAQSFTPAVQGYTQQAYAPQARQPFFQTQVRYQVPGKRYPNAPAQPHYNFQHRQQQQHRQQHQPRYQQQVLYEEDEEDEIPTYGTNERGELVVVDEPKHNPRGQAKIGGLTSLIGGHLGGFGGGFGGHGSHFGGGGGGYGDYGGSHAVHDYDYSDHGFGLGFGGHGIGHSSGGGYGQHHGATVILVNKSKGKKKKIITVQHGFFVPGGTAMFGKFKDLHSCKKSCEITPTCFAGDFDPWLGKCFLHTNITACAAKSAHPAVTHFSKVPCEVVETTRGLITLGAHIFSSLEQASIKDLKTCLKKCATAGGGIAPTTATIGTTPQLCFGIDYDFATHKCFFHVNAALCPAGTVLTPANLSPLSSSINILICPLAS